MGASKLVKGCFITVTDKYLGLCDIFNTALVSHSFKKKKHLDQDSKTLIPIYLFYFQSHIIIFFQQEVFAKPWTRIFWSIDR